MSIDDNEPATKSGSGLTKHLGEALDRFSESGPSFLGGFFTTRISLAYLKKWLHRMGSGLRAGIDIRTLLNQESHNGPLSYRPIFAEFHRRLSKGDSLADAARDAGEFFPAMVVEMIHVGEFTG